MDINDLNELKTGKKKEKTPKVEKDSRQDSLSFNLIQIEPEIAETKIEVEEKKEEIEFEPINAIDTQGAQMYYRAVDTVIKVNGEIMNFQTAYRSASFVCASSWRGTKDLLPTLVAPKDLPKKEPQQSEYEYKQGEIYSYEDLTAERPEVIDNKNFQKKFYEYLFFKEFKACENGFLYYLIPLFIGLALLLLSSIYTAFLPNLITSCVVLMLLLIISPIFKNAKSKLGNIILRLFFFIFFLTCGLILLDIYPTFASKIRFSAVTRLLFIVFDIYYCAKFYVVFILCYTVDCKADFANVVTLNAGKPRVGKTSEAVNEIAVLSKLQWDRLQYHAWKIHSTYADIIARNDADELVEAQNVLNSYSYYIMSPNIPCCWSNIGLVDAYGRESHTITLDHIRGLAKLPMYPAILIDEIGAFLNAELSTNKERPYDVSDMFRLGGHFLKWVVIACEQDFGNVYIDCRRVVGFNRLVLSQEKVNNPLVLQIVFDILKFFIDDGNRKKMHANPKLARFMVNLEKLISSIGFRKYTFSYIENTQTGAEMKGLHLRRVRYAPSNLLLQYDDRAFKEQYPAFYDKYIVGGLHERLFIPFVNGYGDQFVSGKTKAVAEKREQVRKAVTILYQQIESNKVT